MKFHKIWKTYSWVFIQDTTAVRHWACGSSNEMMIMMMTVMMTLALLQQHDPRSLIEINTVHKHVVNGDLTSIAVSWQYTTNCWNTSADAMKHYRRQYTSTVCEWRCAISHDSDSSFSHWNSSYKLCALGAADVNVVQFHVVLIRSPIVLVLCLFLDSVVLNLVDFF